MMETGLHLPWRAKCHLILIILPLSHGALSHEAGGYPGERPECFCEPGKFSCRQSSQSWYTSALYPQCTSCHVTDPSLGHVQRLPLSSTAHALDDCSQDNAQAGRNACYTAQLHTRHAAEPITGHVTEPCATEHTTYHVTETKNGQVTEPKNSHVTEPKTHHLTESSTDHVADPSVQNTTQPPLPVETPTLHYTPAPLGVEVRGVDLKDPNLPDSVVQQIKRDLHLHRLLIFKDQGELSVARHVEISHWFGELKGDFTNHPKGEHPLVLRVSNDPNEGLTGVGTTGWHIDGSFYEKPYYVIIFHMVAVASQGNTEFVPMKEFVESLSPETRARWDRLWVVDLRWHGRHPFLYAHPVTGDPALCFHTGGISGFIEDYQTGSERYIQAEETTELKEEIERELEKDNKRLVYSHKWEQGDVIIADNLALAHHPSKETQLPTSEIGLRILHRTAVGGEWVPRKKANNPSTVTVTTHDNTETR